jgi:hypothetical protein
MRSLSHIAPLRQRVARIERQRNPGKDREAHPGFRFTPSGLRLAYFVIAGEKDALPRIALGEFCLKISNSLYERILTQIRMVYYFLDSAYLVPSREPNRLRANTRR